MVNTSKAFKVLSQEEASHALYIDFEGRTDQPPVLLGVLRREGKGKEPFVYQEIVDERFAVLGGPVLPLSEAVTKVVVRAESNDCRIVSWSEHDLRKVRAALTSDPKLVKRFEARYANGLGVAKRWRWWAHQGERPEKGQLQMYLELIAYPVPDNAVAGDVGETIRRIQKRLDQGLDADRRPAASLAAPAGAQPPRLCGHEEGVRPGDERARGDRGNGVIYRDSRADTSPVDGGLDDTRRAR